MKHIAPHPGHPVPVADHCTPGGYGVAPCQGHPSILKSFYPEILNFLKLDLKLSTISFKHRKKINISDLILFHQRSKNMIHLPLNYIYEKGLKFILTKCINRSPQWGRTSGAAEDLFFPIVAIPYLKTPFRI